jgi:hypothetical protein
MAALGFLRASMDALGDEFPNFVPLLLQRLMQALGDDANPMRPCMVQAIDALTLLGPHLGQWLTAVVDSVALILLDYKETPLPVRLSAVRLLANLAVYGPCFGCWFF